MGQDNTITIIIETVVHAPVESVWEYWTEPKHITKWSYASDEWHAPSAENDLRAGGTFVTRMEAKDGSFGFDFGGVYDEVNLNESIIYTIGDGRKVKIDFKPQDNNTHIIEYFEAEETNELEMQKAGWQAILDNFKKYAEAANEE
ncbi:SRPBCC family protein [Paenibacillus paridis]|uniref:SRPBCC family protein n=1 Tax=Paenibacillus paridis TaxID=2583376 RepID=UPI0011241F20|nr:SRPBCC family protein [Paenibacillus paridis]